MFEKWCLPKLRAAAEAAHSDAVLLCGGIGRVGSDALIAPVYELYVNPVTTILAAGGERQVHLRRVLIPARRRALAGELGEKILAVGQPRIFDQRRSAGGRGGHLLLAAGRRWRWRVVYGGAAGRRITEVAGSSQWFLGGFQVYGTAMKTRLLGLDGNV